MVMWWDRGKNVVGGVVFPIELRPRRRLRALCLLACLASLSLARPARSAPDDQTEKLIRRGVQFRRAGQDEQALEQFRAAYAIHAAPAAKAQIGLAEQALGRWVDAENDVREALEHKGDPWIDKNEAALRGALATIGEHVGALQISGSPAGARVRVDDRDVGTIPFSRPVRVVTGEVVVSVSAPGHTEISRKLTVSAGSLTREVFTLHAVTGSGFPEASNEASRKSAPNPADATRSRVRESPKPITVVEQPMETEHRAPVSTARVWGIGIGSAGIVAAGIGTFFAARAISKNNQSKAGGGCDDRNMCDDPSYQARLDARAAGDRATIAFVVSGALVSAGVVLFLVGGRSDHARLALRITPSAAPGELGAIGTLRF